MTDLPVIRMNPPLLSRIFWNALYRSIDAEVESLCSQASERYRQTAAYRTQADYNTGSISLVDAFNLSVVSGFFRFQNVVEVGTFIGNSTYSIAAGMQRSGVNGVIHTCDLSNAIDLSHPTPNVDIVQYRKTASTEMFNQLVAAGFQADFIYLDGRLQQGDVALLNQICHANTVLGFDDFEGIEKGVVNLSVIANDPQWQKHCHIAPPDYQTLNQLPLFTPEMTRSVTMLLIPMSCFAFTRQ